jgi:hypothetical protein
VQPTPIAHGGALAEDCVVEFLDPIQNLRVQRQGRGDAGPRPLVQQVDSVSGLDVDGAGSFDLLLQGAPYPWVGDAVVVAPDQQVAVYPGGGEFVGGQIDPAAVQVLVDVADEVGTVPRIGSICRPITSAEPYM